MIKKILLGALISSVTLFALPNDELHLEMLSKSAHKKAVVLKTMNLKGDVKEKFGKLYDEYQKKILKTSLQKLDLITNYTINYKQMTNETSDGIIIKSISIAESEIALKKEYILKFRQFLSSAELLRYMQIENRFQHLREEKVLRMVPLAIAPSPSADMAIVTTPKKADINTAK
ncbi:hypothetical protein MNB_SV-5-1514 [hydrothermal vent metagenome]|uniref:Uncharacterized protein n=1 Tax=hydrothermal vent metagenome TaxID=652676 RepID=A0A1W1EET6_9ZZZZ